MKSAQNGKPSTAKRIGAAEAVRRYIAAHPGELIRATDIAAVYRDKLDPHLANPFAAINQALVAQHSSGQITRTVPGVYLAPGTTGDTPPPEPETAPEPEPATPADRTGPIDGHALNLALAVVAELERLRCRYQLAYKMRQEDGIVYLEWLRPQTPTSE